MILDEAALLGHMDAIDNAVGIGRGYGVRLTLIYQSLGQLRTSFPDGQEQTLLSNTSQVYFAVNDQATADQVSARLGEQTIVLASGGTNGRHVVAGGRRRPRPEPRRVGREQQQLGPPGPQTA